MRIDAQGRCDILMTYKLLYWARINAHTEQQGNNAVTQIVKVHMS